MSTNYYAITNRCGFCGRSNREHIGKRSGGEVFFYAGDDAGKRSWTAWKEYLASKHVELIEDEYRRPVDLSTFVAMVESMPNRGKQYESDSAFSRYGDSAWLDDEGYSFCTWEFS